MFMDIQYNVAKQGMCRFHARSSKNIFIYFRQTQITVRATLASLTLLVQVIKLLIKRHIAFKVIQNAYQFLLCFFF